MSRTRVDSWDEDDELRIADRGLRNAEPDQTNAHPAAPTTQQAPETPQSAIHDPQSATPDPSWGQMIRGAPGWIWLIAIVSLGSICVMFFTIMFLMATLP